MGMFQTWLIGSWNRKSLQWRHNEHDGVSNHQRLDCLFSRLFRRRSKETLKLCVTGLCEGNQLVTGGFPYIGPVTKKFFHLMTSSWIYNVDVLYLLGSLHSRFHEISSPLFHPVHNGEVHNLGNLEETYPFSYFCICWRSNNVKCWAICNHSSDQFWSGSLRANHIQILFEITGCKITSIHHAIYLIKIMPQWQQGSQQGFSPSSLMHHIKPMHC